MKEQPELKVEMAKTADLVPYANNAKLHNETQVEQIAKSIKEFGFSDPVGVWTNSDGKPEIVEGHGRVLAAKKLGMKTIPVVYLDHLSDEARRAYTHTHNQLTLNTGFDLEVLEDEIEALPEYDWEAFGFEQPEPETDEWESAEDSDDGERKFDVLFVCHGEEEKERLKSLLGITGELKPMYLASEIEALNA